MGGIAGGPVIDERPTRTVWIWYVVGMAKGAPVDESAPKAIREIRYVDRMHSAALILVVFGLWAFRLGGPIDLRWDAGVYYILGTSLYEGKGYRLLNEPGEIRAVQYPPLLPAVVAAHQWLAGDERPAVAGRLLRWTMAGTTVAYVIAAYQVARWWLLPASALAAAMLVAAHSMTLFMSDLCFAEIPFGLACLGFLAVNRAGHRGYHEAAAGTIGAACYLLRTLGLALLAAWVLEAAVRRHFALAAFRATVAAVPVLAWQGYVSHIRHAPEYARPAYPYQRAPYLMHNVSYGENMSLLDPFTPEQGPATLSRVARRTLDHLRILPATLGEAVSAPEIYWRALRDPTKWRVGRHLGMKWLVRRHLGWLASSARLALGGLVLAGIGVLAARREWLVVIFLGATSAMICLSPWPGQFNRYFTPLAPLLAVSMILGVSATCRYLKRLGPSWGRAATAGAIALWIGLVPCVAIAIYSMTRGNTGSPRYVDSGGVSQKYWVFHYTKEWSSFDAALAWLKQAADAGDVVATTAPHWTYLTTGLKAVQPPYEPDPDAAQRLLDSVPAKYVIVDALQGSGGSISRRYTAPAIRSHPRLWELAYESPGGDVRIYRRVGRGRR
jgi:hypothetical protein